MCMLAMNKTLEQLDDTLMRKCGSIVQSGSDALRGPSALSLSLFPTLFCSLHHDIYGVDAMRCGVLSFWVLPRCATVLAKETLELLCLMALFGREKEDRLFIIWVTELLVYHKLRLDQSGGFGFIAPYPRD